MSVNLQSLQRSSTTPAASDSRQSGQSTLVTMSPQAHRREQPLPAIAYMGLGVWNIYFLTKFFLYWKQYIGFHVLENLAFAAFLLVPVRSATGRILRQLLALPVGIALFYYDSWLPPVERLFSQATNLQGFSLTYLAELAGRFIDIRILAILVLIWAGTQILSHYLRIGTLVTTTLIAMLIWDTLEQQGIPLPATTTFAANTQGEGQTPQTTSDGTREPLGAVLEGFYRQEAGQQVNFPAPAPDSVPFDLLFLHVCSLSWDDLALAGLTNHPLFDRFDLLFTNFNSASSYSGPATVRLLRATCGQPSHHDLYQPAPAHCYLFENLSQAGFTPQLAMNHDGHFDGFLEVVRERGKLKASLLPLDDIAIAQRSFDDSPIHGDLAVLGHWLEQRQRDKKARVATYYNSISLHDGNRLVAGPGSELNSLESYPLRLQQLLDDLEQFLHQVETSGRRMVLVLVPEHGAAIRGDRMQIAGLREIPSPAITRVPVAIKIIGPGLERQGDQLRIEDPVSYLTISHIIERLLQEDTFGGKDYDPARLVADLSRTDFVAENEGTVVMRHDGRYHLRLEGEAWMDYPVAEAKRVIP